MKYKFCKFPCPHCQGKLKQKTFKRKWNNLPTKLTRFTCMNCTEWVVPLSGGTKMHQSKFEIAYETVTGKPAAAEIWVDNYRILCMYTANKSFVSKGVIVAHFDSMGQGIEIHSYTSIVTIDAIPNLDFTDLPSILQKIKLFLTFS